METKRSFIGKSVLLAIVVIALVFGSCDEPNNNDNEIPPEEKTPAERWSTRLLQDSTATLDLSVDDDGVCTMTVGGIAMPHNSTGGWLRYYTSGNYSYTARANTSYIYEFEAWTESGSRNMTISSFDYAWDYYGDDGVKDISINSTRQKFTFTGPEIPEDMAGVRVLEFYCADLLGTFYVKILDIKQVIPPETKPVAERWTSWANPESGVTVSHSVANDGVVTVTVGGTAELNVWLAEASYQYTVQKEATYTYEFEAWTASGSGNRTLNVQYYGGGDANVLITAGPPYLGKSQVITEERKMYTITGTITGSPTTNSGATLLQFQCANQIGTFYVKVISITQQTSGGNDNGGGGGGGTFTLTGIPSTYNGKYAFLCESSYEIGIYGFQTINFSTENENTLTLPRISNGSVSIPLWIPNAAGTNFIRYSGNHTLEVVVVISNVPGYPDDDDYVTGVYFESVAFSSGSATKSWSAGEVETP